jgi:hypothetical protein
LVSWAAFTSLFWVSAAAAFIRHPPSHSCFEDVLIMMWLNRITQRRYVFAIGSHLRFRNGRIGRIDGIFVHEMLRLDRLFIKLTELIPTGVIDEFLELPYVTYSSEVIVSLPTINTKQIYVVDIESKDATVLVDWSIQFL